MSEHHANLVIRFYPRSGQWTCVVQKVDGDGMPIGGDLVHAVGGTKEEARAQACASTNDGAVIEALKSYSGR
jgi:hypothetical protein